MPITYTYDVESKTVRTTPSGSITTAELLEYLQDVTENPQVEAGFVELVDFSQTDDLVIRYTETQIFKSIWKSYMAKGCRATIIYAPTDICYGISRMLQAVIGSVEDFDPGSFQVVRTKEQLDRSVEEIRRRDP